MKANNTLTVAPFLLKTVGGLLILASLVEYILLFFPPAVSDPKLLEQYWKIDFWNQLVNSGIVPLVGMLLIFAGYWMNITLNIPNNRPSWRDLRLWISTLATILGITYLIAIPIYLNNVNYIKEESIKQDVANAAEAKDRLNKESEQRVSQLTEVQKAAQDKTKLDGEIARVTQAINSGQIQGEELQRINNYKANLENLKNNSQAIAQNIQQVRDSVKKQSERVDSELAKSRSIKANNAVLSVIKTGLKSLILGIAYTILGWFGLRNVLAKSDNPIEKWE